MTTPSAPWHILGVGAIGGLFAQRLQSGGVPVALLSRCDNEATRELHFNRDEHTTEVERFTCEPVTGDTPIHRLLVCTKSYAVTTAVTALAHRLSTSATVVVLCNGMGAAEDVAAQHPQLRCAVGCTTAAGFRDSAGHWHRVAEGDTRIGWLNSNNQSAPDWFDRWQSAIPSLIWQSAIGRVRLQKLAINAVINPATALFDIPNGALLSPAMAADCERACAEVSAVLASLGHHDIAGQVATSVRQVAAQTAANISSMRSDMRAGKPTEVEAILGYLLEHLRPQAQHTVATPLLDQWLRRLRRYEASLGVVPE